MSPDVPDAPQAQAVAPGLEKLARDIPGFGGFYLDRDGTPTVFLTNPLMRRAAEVALGPWMRSQGLDPVAMRVRQGQFEYGQLDRWSRSATMEALPMAGAVWVDLDEATNRVRIGVERGASAAAIRAAVMRAGVPESAIEIDETEPVELMATLRDQIRPVQGGLQIHFTQYLCTLGFNAVSGSTNSFITNSHCTATQGGVENTVYYQPSSSSPNSMIGTEVADPTYTRGQGCPRGKKCRYSDASRAAYAAGVSSALGTIARTTGANNGSLEIAGTFTITGENTSSTFPVGTVLNKVGRTTGWTQGTVSQTCVNTSVQGSNIAQLCQTFVQAGVGSGDSGSPVFALNGSNSVTLVGILWGGSGSNLFVFSPLGNIEQELGALRTF